MISTSTISYSKFILKEDMAGTKLHLEKRAIVSKLIHDTLRVYPTVLLYLVRLYRLGNVVPGALYNVALASVVHLKSETYPPHALSIPAALGCSTTSSVSNSRHLQNQN